jgi:hypothetical protein
MFNNSKTSSPLDRSIPKGNHGNERHGSIMKMAWLIPILVLTFIGCQKSKQNSTRTSAEASALHVFQQAGRFGYKDLTGIVVLDAQFADAGEFSEDLARVRTDPNGPWSYINGSGDVMIPAQFDGASDFHNGKALVLSNDKYFFVGPDGKRLDTFDEETHDKPLSVGDTLYVIHPNGLIARGLGDLNASAMGQVQFGEAVTYAYDPHPRQFQSIEGLRGSWLCVRYQNKQGYLFDLYLSRFPQATEKRAVETYRVVVSAKNDNSYSVYTLTRYSSGGFFNTHDASQVRESREIVPNATVEQVLARLKLFPTGEIGPIVQRFTGESGSFTNENGETVTVTVRRFADGFFDTISFSNKSDAGTFDFTLTKVTREDVEITTSTTSEGTENETPSETGEQSN